MYSIRTYNKFIIAEYFVFSSFLFFLPLIQRNTTASMNQRTTVKLKCLHTLRIEIEFIHSKCIYFLGIFLFFSFLFFYTTLFTVFYVFTRWLRNNRVCIDLIKSCHIIRWIGFQSFGTSSLSLFVLYLMCSRSHTHTRIINNNDLRNGSRTIKRNQLINIIRAMKKKKKKKIFFSYLFGYSA